MTVPAWWSELKHFSPSETFEQGGEVKPSFPRPDKMDRDTMVKLDLARELAAVPFTITSSYREGDDGAHGKGLAVDIRVKGSRMRDRVHHGLEAAGFPRRGVYDKHVHGDTDTSLPPGLWAGVSS